MSAPQRPQLGLPSSRPEGPEDPYFEDQWSDDPTDERDEAPRRSTRLHSIPSRAGRSSSFTPGEGARGETVPYGHGRPTAHRADTDPFSPTSGPRSMPYSGYYGMPTSTPTPFTPGQQYSSPPGGYPRGPGYYTGYGTGYTTTPPPQPSPFSSRAYYPTTPAEQSSYGYTSPYEPSPSQQPFGSSFNDGRTSIRGPTIRVRKTQVPPSAPRRSQSRPRYEDSEREREAEEQHWRERSRQREREEREARRRKKEREWREMGRIKFKTLKLQIEKLQNQLDLERTKGSARGDFEPGLRVQDLMQYMQTQREQESQRRLVEKNDSMTQLLQDLAEVAEAKREAQARQDRLQLLGGLSPRSRPRSAFGDVSYELEQRRMIEEVLRQILRGGGSLWDEEVTRLPLPAHSHYTGRSASEDLHAEDEFQRSVPRGWPEDDGGVSPRPRYSDAPGNVGDPCAGTSSPRYRTADPGPGIIRDPYPPSEPSRYGSVRYSGPSSTPRLERRQTAPPVGPTPILKVHPPGSSKRARGSDFSSDHSLPADRGEYSPYDPRDDVLRRAELYQEKTPLRETQYREELPPRAEQYRDGLPPRTEPFGEEPRRRADTPRGPESERPEIRRADSHRSFGTRRSSQSAPRSAHSPERPGLRRNRPRAAFQDQDPAGGRPILDGGDDTSASESGDRLRRTGSYRFTGERVTGRRYNAREGRGLTPPEAPEAPRTQTPTATARPQRPPRRAQVKDDWSDDEEVHGGRFTSRSRESTVGR